MDWEREVVEAFVDNDVEVVAYLPDGALADLVERVEAEAAFETVRVTREEEAVGVLAGAYLGGAHGALCCQSSGLANALNAVTSLCQPARLPFLGVVSRRGDLGEFNRAQVPFGYNLPAVLDDIGVRNHSLAGADDVRRVTDGAAKTAFSTGTPYVLLLESSLTGAKDEF